MMRSVVSRNAFLAALLGALLLIVAFTLSPQHAFAANPSITSVSIQSSNSSTTLAHPTDTIGLYFSSNLALKLGPANDSTSTSVIFSGPMTGQASSSVIFLSGSGPFLYVASSSALSGGTDGTFTFMLVADSGGTGTTTVTQATGGVTNAKYDDTNPTIAPITIASNNSNSSALAKIGDTVTLSFTSSEAIQAPSVTIGTHSVTAVTSNPTASTTWTASATLNSSDTDGSAVTFTINSPEDMAGNATTSPTWLTSGSQVIFDKTAPTITLLGSNTVTLSQGLTYTDAGATASDSRDGSLTSSISTTNPVNTSVPGTYTVTYNVSDSAGNPASPVTRTVVINGGGGGIVGCIGVVNAQGSTACSGAPSSLIPGTVHAILPGTPSTPSTNMMTTVPPSSHGVSGASTLTKHLQFGMRNSSDVSLLQTLLAQNPTIYPAGLVTGYFGPLTLQAVEKFQLTYGVTTTADPAYGEVGPKTRAELITVFGK